MSDTRNYAEKMGYTVDEEMTLDIQRKIRLSQKKMVTIRLPEDVIESFKTMAGEDGKYQQLMREVLIEAASKKAS